MFKSLIEAASRPQFAWREEDAARKAYYADYHGGRYTGQKRRYFEIIAMQNDASLLELISKTNPVAFRTFMEAVNSKPGGGIAHEAASLSHATEGLPEQNLRLLDTMMSSTFLFDVYGVQTMDKPDGLVWYQYPITKDEFEDAYAGTVAAETALDNFYGQVVPELTKQTSEGATFQTIKDDLAKAAVSIDTFGLRYEAAWQRAMDFGRHFGGSYSGRQVDNLGKIMSRCAQWLVLYAHYGAVPAGNNVQWNKLGYTAYANDFLAYERWEKTIIEKLSECTKKVYPYTNAPINTVIGRYDDLDAAGFFKIGKENTAFQTTPQWDNAMQNNLIGNIGGIQVGTFKNQFKVYMAQDIPSDYQGKLITCCAGPDEFTKPGIICTMNMGLLSPIFFNDTNAMISQLMVDRWKEFFPTWLAKRSCTLEITETDLSE